MTGLDLTKIEGFDWDKGNIEKNQKVHNVSVDECQEIFFNQPLAIFDDPGHSNTEKRYGALGISDNGRKLAIYFTVRNRKIRVISARDQSKKNRGFFEQISKREVKNDQKN